MELREWLIILGLALVTLIVVDGVRRLQRQRRTPRLDEGADDAGGTSLDPEEAAREAEINWELPNGGARVVRPADYSGIQPKPKLERQEHPGPSRVLASFRQAGRQGEDAAPVAPVEAERQHAPPETRSEAIGKPDAPLSRAANSTGASRVDEKPAMQESRSAASSVLPPSEEAQQVGPREDVESSMPHAAAETSAGTSDERLEPRLSSLDESPEEAAELTEPLAAVPEDHDEHDTERYRLVDLDGMSDSFKSGSKRVGASVQRFGASLQKSLSERREQKRQEKLRREQAKAEKAARDAEQQRQARIRAEEEQAVRDAERRRLEAETIRAADDDDPLFAPPQANRDTALHDEEWDLERTESTGEAAASLDDPAFRDKVRVHPVLEKALRHDVSAEHARHALSHAEEIIVISVMSRDEEGFSGTALLDLMLACGLRYSRDMGIFHRFETEDPESQLQFSMVNVVKPGVFPIEAMDDFHTPGVTLLMPLPGATDSVAAFEAMVETAMVIVRHLGGELKDENHSVMTAQTVEFARQRVQEFVRRHRLHRYQVN